MKVLEIGISPLNPLIKALFKMPLTHALEWNQCMPGIPSVIKDEQGTIEFIEIRHLNAYTQTTLPLQLQPYVSMIKEYLTAAKIYEFTDNKLNYIK